jgi:hypothetical protein
VPETPETFSSELGELAERARAHDSFNDEFQGASDSLIRNDRPELVGGRGRTGILLVVLVFLVPILGFAGFALWYWSEPIGSWIAGIGRRADTQVEAPEEVVEEDEVAVVPDLPPASDRVFGIKGSPDGSEPVPETQPAQPDTPAQPDPQPQPNPPPKAIETVSTDVRGKVGRTSIESRLAKVDAALPACWASESAAGPVELVLTFTIRWNGRVQASTLKGGSENLRTCVRKALPTSGWPQPSDGGEATVTRTWNIN